MTAIIYIRSILDLNDLFSNVRWLLKKDKTYKQKMRQENKENFIICIPMLREQRVAADTLNYFSKLDYPKNKYKIIVVTTSKETADKKTNSYKLQRLSSSIAEGRNIDFIKEQYLGILPSYLLESFYKSYKLKDKKKVLSELKRTYLELPTTFELANKIAKIINLKLGKKLISVMNYPHIEGVMSHQINHVVKELNKNKENKNSIFAVYNADSRPNLNTLKYVSLTLSDYESRTGTKPNIVQQSSLFTLNYNKYPKTISGYILRSASLFQTRWTMIRELSRFRSQSEHVIKYSNNLISKFINTRISHCVGHGLFVRFGLLANEYLPTETINEDLPFGYYQCCKGEPILPLSILENSETPETIKGLIRQKRFWFTPYLQYLKCRERVLSLGKYRSKMEVEILTTQAEFTGFVWLVQSFVLFTPLLVAIIFENLLLLTFWLGAICLYWFISIAFIYVQLDKLEKIAGKSTTKKSLMDYLLISFSGLFILATHSIGPVLCIRDFLLESFFEKPIVKLKTER